MTKKALSRVFLVFVFMFITVFMIPQPARAAEIVNDEADVVIDEDYDDDLIIFGETVEVNSTIDGDLLVFAESLDLNGTVTGDLMFFGAWATISGEVEDDIRSAGALIRLENDAVVGDDLFAGAASIEMVDDAVVVGDLFAAANQVIVGNVSGNAHVGGAKVMVDGVVEGDAILSYAPSDSYSYDWTMNMPPDFPAVMDIPGGLTFSDKGQITGDVEYFTNNEDESIEEYVGGSLTFFDTTEPVPEFDETGHLTVRNPFLRFLGRAFGTFAIAALFGLIFMKVFSDFSGKSLGKLKENAAGSLGVGVLGYMANAFLIGLFIAIVFGLLAFGALSTGFVGPFLRGFMLMGVSYKVIFTWVTKWFTIVLFSILLGSWVYSLIEKEREAPYVAFLIGLVFVSLLVSVPFISTFFVNPIIRAFTLGAVILAYWPAKKETAGEPMAVKTEITGEPAE